MFLLTPLVNLHWTKLNACSFLGSRRKQSYNLSALQFRAFLPHLMDIQTWDNSCYFSWCWEKVSPLLTETFLYLLFAYQIVSVSPDFSVNLLYFWLLGKNKYIISHLKLKIPQCACLLKILFPSALCHSSHFFFVQKRAMTDSKQDFFLRKINLNWQELAKVKIFAIWVTGN